MKPVSIYDARLAAVIADAEAITALEGAADRLARGGAIGCAFFMHAVLTCELSRPGAPRWDRVSVFVERAGRRNESSGRLAEVQEFVGGVLVQLDDAVNQAWEAQLRLGEILQQGEGA